jgi:serine protease inhibitor
MVSFSDTSENTNFLLPLEPLFRGLTLIAVGSRGRTQEEVLRLFACENADELFSYYRRGYPQFAKLGNENKFYGALSWERHPPYPKFVEFSSKHFSMPFLIGNYDSINNWVTGITSRKISDTLSAYPLGSSYIMYLMGTYSLPSFGELLSLRQSTFHLGHGATIRVDFLEFNANLSYVQDQYAQTVFIEQGSDGKDGNIIALVLPNSKVISGDNNHLISFKYLSNLFDSYTTAIPREIDVSLPKVNFVDKGSLKKNLVNAGLKGVFDPARARLSLVSNQGIHFSDVLFYFQLSIPHCELPVVSKIPTRDNGVVFPPLQLIYDRPFYLVSLNKKTGLPNLIAKIVNPTQ